LTDDYARQRRNELGAIRLYRGNAGWSDFSGGTLKEVATNGILLEAVKMLARASLSSKVETAEVTAGFTVEF
jgi:hypothetical protein